MNKHSISFLKQKTNIAILVAALGYFVDVYDIVLFSIVRIDSLKSLGIINADLINEGVFLLNMQMIGMLLGGILWGVLGDKIGRIEVLFGSILLYSIANILNAFIYDVGQYAALRFLAGLGLAGEIGAGITLVSELMPKEQRGYGTTIVATVGVMGAIAAALVGDLFYWRTAYIIGGLLGLALLVLRVSVSESGLFSNTKAKTGIVRGNLIMLVTSRERFLRYLYCILVGLPIWFVVGLIVTFCPEIGAALGINEPIKVSTSVLCYSVGITLGDLLSGLASQWLKSRKLVMGVFIGLTFALSMTLLNLKLESANSYYIMLFPIGFFIGYWAVFITVAAEQFGTNLRATVATTVPNFVRGTTVIMTLMFNFSKDFLGVVLSVQLICYLVCLLAFIALLKLRETFACDLDFEEY